MLAVVGIGLAYSAAILGLAIIERRRRPEHPVPWLIAVVILGLDVAVHIVMSIGSVAESLAQGGWLVVATIAIACLLGAAALRPRLAGIGLIGAAVLMPLALIIVSAWPGVDAAQLVPLPVMLAFWSTRAVIVGLLLVFSETHVRVHAHRTVSM